MKKITSKKFTKRLASYGALAVSIAAISDASGQIIYTDVDPDETLTGTRFLLDLNGDATIDFEISNDGVFSGVTPGTTARVYTDNSSSILGINGGGNYNYPFALSEGAMVDAGESTWITNTNYQTLNWQGCAYTNSQWCDGQVDKYLGLRISVGTDLHYGWVRLDVAADASSIVVKDYAFNSVPGEGIEAGQTLGVNEVNRNAFTHSYNKSNALLTLQSSTIAFNNIQLFNVLGQEVMNHSLSQTSEKISLAHLQDGVYIAKVAIEGQIETVKLLKQ